jgi:hypothetical protein
MCLYLCPVPVSVGLPIWNPDGVRGGEGEQTLRGQTSHASDGTESQCGYVYGLRLRRVSGEARRLVEMRERAGGKEMMRMVCCRRGKIARTECF